METLNGTNQKQALSYGAEPGLRFACVLDGAGGATALTWDGVSDWLPSQGVLWIHLERDDPAAERWLRGWSGVDPVTCDALVAEESRPRVDEAGKGLLLVLRGINHRHAGDDTDLVPIHVLVEDNRIITLRDKDHSLLALRIVREALAVGRGPCRVGDLLVQIADKVVRDVEDVLDDLDEEIDGLDDDVEKGESGRDIRRPLGEVRRQAIHLRRYLAPQREALYRLQTEGMDWLNERDGVRLREVIDKVIRHVEHLDSIRDHSTLLHEELAAIVSERTALIANRLTALTAILLPPSLLAGLLGMNVAGIPGAEHPWSFAALCGIVLVMFAGEIWFLRKLKWF